MVKKQGLQLECNCRSRQTLNENRRWHQHPTT